MFETRSIWMYFTIKFDILNAMMQSVSRSDVISAILMTIGSICTQFARRRLRIKFFIDEVYFAIKHHLISLGSDQVDLHIARHRVRFATSLFDVLDASAKAILQLDVVWTVSATFVVRCAWFVHNYCWFETSSTCNHLTTQNAIFWRFWCSERVGEVYFAIKRYLVSFGDVQCTSYLIHATLFSLIVNLDELT